MTSLSPYVQRQRVYGVITGGAVRWRVTANQLDAVWFVSDVVACMKVIRTKVMQLRSANYERETSFLLSCRLHHKHSRNITINQLKQCIYCATSRKRLLVQQGCQTGWTTGCMFTRREWLDVGFHESNRLNSHNRLHVDIDDTTGCPVGCQTGLTTGSTTGCIV